MESTSMQERLAAALADRKWFPYRLSAQLFAYIGVAAILGGITFAYASIHYSREIIRDQMEVVAHSIATVSAEFVVVRDLQELEHILIGGARFPFVEEVLIVDLQGRRLAEVKRDNGVLRAHYGADLVALPPVNGVETGVEAGKKQNQVWQSIQAAEPLGGVRLRYNLDQLNGEVIKHALKTFGLALLGNVLLLLALVMLLRRPMQALQEVTAFAGRLSDSLGAKIAIYRGTKEFSDLSQALNRLSSQLLYQRQDLNERIEQNQSILDNMVDGTITIDGLGTIRSFNLAAATIFGYTSDEIIGQNIKALMPEPYQIQHDGYLAHYHQTGEQKIIGIGRIVEGLRKNGEVFPLDLAISRCVDHNEPIFIGIVRDITERLRLERLKSEFVATVSHELRTPMTSIHGSLRLLEGGIAGVLPAGAAKLVGVAVKNSERLIILINDLLDFERLTSGKMALELKPTDVTEVLKQAITNNAVFAAGLNVTYVLDAPNDAIMVQADAARLMQVVTNLMANAAKFSGGALLVNLRVHVDGRSAKVEVEDHGKGIAADFQKEIFGAFAQANNGDTRAQGGTGLGLKICKGLIDAMAGEIGFVSQEGHGSTFWFSLPLSDISDYQDGPQAADTQALPELS